MEELQENLQKELARLSSRRRPKRRRRWTLLFVGAHGEVRRIERFAGLTMVAAGLVLAAALATACLYLVYKRPMAENLRLKGSLAAVRQENRALRGEKDLMLARLVVAEARGKRPETVASPAQGEPLPAKPPETSAKSVPGPVPEPASAARKPAAQPTAPLAADMGRDGGRPVPDPVPRVTVESLMVSGETDTGQLSIQFRIKNEGPESQPISGRTFVVLESGGGREVLTIPRVPLENGRPAVVKNGRYFSIARFNTVTFKTADAGDLKRFRRATVLVYALSGELLLERHFAIEKNAS